MSDRRQQDNKDTENYRNWLEKQRLQFERDRFIREQRDIYLEKIRGQ